MQSKKGTNPLEATLTFDSSLSLRNMAFRYRHSQMGASNDNGTVHTLNFDLKKPAIKLYEDLVFIQEFLFILT